LHPLVGQRRACDVAAQLFQRVARVGAAAHGLGAVLDALKVVTALSAMSLELDGRAIRRLVFFKTEDFHKVMYFFGKVPYDVISYA
jgi:hypothetical protein